MCLLLIKHHIVITQIYVCKLPAAPGLTLLLSSLVATQRNAYLWDYLNKFDGQRIACQRTITVGLKGLQNYSEYQPTNIETVATVHNDPWNTGRMMNELSQMDYDEPNHPILQHFDSSEGFDVPDFSGCPLEDINAP